MTKARILLIEDDDSSRELGEFNLTRAGFEVDTAPDGDAGLHRFSSSQYDLVVTDIRMPGRSGMEVLKEVKQREPEVPVIMVTAYANVDMAVDAMKAGAHDFIGKPFNRDHLILAVGKALESRDLKREVRRLRVQASGIERPLVYSSQAMHRLIETVDRVAPSNASVLITGESGTGKELIARRIHVRSTRAEAPFVALNCAAVPGELLESELFGHEKGSFTGAARSRRGRFRQAEGGTLFLDEVAEIPPAMQSKLLRVLQERVVDVVGRDTPTPVDVRIIAATNKDLRRRITEGAFREDLYYRLAVIELALPSLRERQDDIPGLVEHFVNRYGGDRELAIPQDLMDELARQSWPGNVRELENVCERLVLLAGGDELSRDDLPSRWGEPSEELATGKPAELSTAEWPSLPDGGLSLIELERRVIERVLVRERWNVSQAARYLRVPRHILTYRMEKHGIHRP